MQQKFEWVISVTVMIFKNPCLKDREFATQTFTPRK